MESHEPDLRAEVDDENEVRRIQEDYRSSGLDEVTKRLLDFAVKLTTTPKKMAKADLDVLRSCGFRDEGILDAIQLVAYFNYINRVIDSLGTEPEPGMPCGRSEPSP